MIHSKCCICGTVKNCGPYLAKVFQNMEIIGRIFDDFKIIIAYDKSNDNSLDILKKYQTKYPDKIILHVENEPMLEYRTHNIARARNNILKLIRSKFADYEYFIMMDCDDVCAQPIIIENLLFYLIVNTDWDALSFNRKSYYDTWALSKYPFVFSNMHFKNPDKLKIFIEDIMNKTPPKTLVPCLSAFNGFAIYKTNKFISYYYDPKPRLDLIPNHLIENNIKVSGPMYMKGKAAEVDCEHRSFHLMAINDGAKIRIAPEIIF